MKRLSQRVIFSQTTAPDTFGAGESGDTDLGGGSVSRRRGVGLAGPGVGITGLSGGLADAGADF